MWYTTEITLVISKKLLFNKCIFLVEESATQGKIGNFTSLNTNNVNFSTRRRPYQREASWPSGPGRDFF